MNALPKPQDSLWTSYVFYVVNRCSCGNTYYYPSRRQIRIDQLTPQRLDREIEEIPLRVDTSCNKCGRTATPNDARRAVLGLGMPDHSGCILCDFTIENGHVKRKRFRFDKTPDPVQFFREHPDYFRTQPPDNSPTELDDLLCLEELGRVLSARSSWIQTLNQALELGASFAKLQPGYYIFATTSDEPATIEAQMRELGDEEFWEFFQREPIPRRHLNGIRRWTEEQRQKANLDTGYYSEWLPQELVEAIDNKKLFALTFTIDSISLRYLADAASYYGLEIDEVIPADGSPPQWWVRKSEGLARPFPPLDLLQLGATYRGLLLSDQIWTVSKHANALLKREDYVFKRLSDRLPPGFSTSWIDHGKLMISRGDKPLELLTFAHIADNIDPDDDEAISRLVSWLISKKSCECPRYVGKRLVSKQHFQQNLSQFLRNSDFLVFKERDQNTVEVYTDECEHQVVFGVKMAKGDPERAEALFVKDLDEHKFSLQYVKKRTLLRGTQMVALIGKDASALATHPSLLRGALENLKVKLGRQVRIFAPFNGILTVAPIGISEEKLEKFAYEVAREVPNDSELKTDHLAFHDIIELETKPLGKFQFELFSPELP